MDTRLLDRIRKAVDEGVSARSRYYASIELPDEQRLGAPAPEALITELEARIGRSLPPSYRAFLSLHNGWHMVDGVTDLLPVEAQLDGALAIKVNQWQAECAHAGDARAARGLVIGWADINPTRLILDPEQADDADGEWRLIQHYKDEECDYPSFIEWLEESVLDFNALARGNDEDENEDED